MNGTNKREDRRVLRTRQLLRSGFIETMREKGFAAMSVQDIADRANVNRGTFYIHFTDKYMLLDEIVRDTFRQQLAAALPAEPMWERETLRKLVAAVLHCFEEKYRHRQPAPRFPAALLEQTIREELTKLLQDWLLHEGEDRGHPQNREQAAVRARIVGWSIFGAAVQWSREPASLALEQMTDCMLSVVWDGTKPAFTASEFL